MRHIQWAALAAALFLLAGCGGGTPDPSPVQPPEETEKIEEREPDRKEPEQEPEEEPEEEPEQDGGQPEEDLQPTEPQDTETAGPEEAGQEPAPAPEPEPEPEPEPVPAAPSGPAVPEDGTYTASVTLEGGTGRSTVESPAKLRCEGGQFWATIVWSSSNYDYMKVDGQKYDTLNNEGNSTFEIPVAAFDQKLDVIADTIAMSEPHEVAYTLQFDSATLAKS